MSAAARAAKQAVKLAAAAGDMVLGPMPGPKILIYHQVGAGTGLEMEVSAEDFRRQLDWLSANGEVVDLATAIASRDLPASSRMFVLTFDDGYADVYRHAFPLLRERSAPLHALPDHQADRDERAVCAPMGAPSLSLGTRWGTWSIKVW